MKAFGSQQPQPRLVQPQVGRMPDLLPQVPQVTVDFAPAIAPAPGNVHVQPSAPGDVKGLTMQIKQMKNEMIHYASLLHNPVWKQQQPDGGKAVRVYQLYQPQLVACWQCHVLQPAQPVYQHQTQMLSDGGAMISSMLSLQVLNKAKMVRDQRESLKVRLQELQQK